MKQYFSHDLGARNDEKCVVLRMVHGLAGYGLYWCLVERLAESSNYMCVKDYNMIAFDLRSDAKLVKSVVEDFGLFAFTDDGKCFYSESLLGRMRKKDETSAKRQEAAKKRWSAADDTTHSNHEPCKSNAIASKTSCKCNAIAKQKPCKEKKEEKRKKREEKNTLFDSSSSEIRYDSSVPERVDRLIALWNQIPHVVKADLTPTGRTIPVLTEFVASTPPETDDKLIEETHNSKFLQSAWENKQTYCDLYWAVMHAEQLLAGMYRDLFNRDVQNQTDTREKYKQTNFKASKEDYQERKF